MIFKATTKFKLEAEEINFKKKVQKLLPHKRKSVPSMKSSILRGGKYFLALYNGQLQREEAKYALKCLERLIYVQNANVDVGKTMCEVEWLKPGLNMTSKLSWFVLQTQTEN